MYLKAKNYKNERWFLTMSPLPCTTYRVHDCSARSSLTYLGVSPNGRGRWWGGVYYAVVPQRPGSVFSESRSSRR